MAPSRAGAWQRAGRLVSWRPSALASSSISMRRCVTDERSRRGPLPTTSSLLHLTEFAQIDGEPLRATRRPLGARRRHRVSPEGRGAPCRRANQRDRRLSNGRFRHGREEQSLIGTISTLRGERSRGSRVCLSAQPSVLQSRRNPFHDLAASPPPKQARAGARA